MPKHTIHFQSAMPRDAVIKLLRMHAVPVNDIAMICGLTPDYIMDILGSQKVVHNFDYMSENEKTAVENFPAFLNSWRETEGITQEEAAKILGISRSVYDSWERNKNRCITAFIVVRYIQAISKIPFDENESLVELENTLPPDLPEIKRKTMTITPEIAREFLRLHKP